MPIQLTDKDDIKLPGEWRRKGKNGPPIVTDPNGEAVKTGVRAGMVKEHTYSRPSNFGKQVENTYNLERWKMRQGVLGVHLDRSLLDELAELWEQDDHDNSQWKEAVDDVYHRAADAAGAMTAAERGTFGHLLTEDHDLGRSVVTRIVEGEDLGLPPALQTAIQLAWAKLVDEHFEILAVEAACVYDHWRVAGTLDRIVRLKHDMTFRTPSGSITFPAGTVVVLDVKTGGLKVAPSTDTPLYWHSYAVQIAAYARSVPYDVDAEKRGQWSWDVNPDHAIIAHIDIAGALDTGVLTTRLVYVDIAAGHEAGEVVLDCKSWQKRKDVFGVVTDYEQTIDLNALPDAGPTEASGEVEAVVEYVDPELAKALTGDCDGCPNECGQCDAAQPAKPIDTERLAYDVRKQQLYARYDALDPDAQSAFGSQVTAIDATDLDAVEALLDRIENPTPTIDQARERMEADRQRDADRRLAAEGGPADPDDIKLFEGRWELGMRDRERRWTGTVVKQAIESNCDFRLSTLSTKRRADIYCALTEWCTVDEFDDHDDSPLRAAVLSATDDEGLVDPAIPIGQVLGMLTTRQASNLRTVVTEIANGRASYVVPADADVAPRWVPNTNK